MSMPPLDKSLAGLLRDMVDRLGLVERRLNRGSTGTSGGGAGTGLAAEGVRDVIGATLVAGVGVGIVVDDAADHITISATSTLTRRSVAFVSASLVAGGQQTAAVTVAPSFDVFYVTADRACRVRLYDTTAHRDADAARPVATLPTDTSPNHGCLLEVIFAAAGTQTITDGVTVFVPTGSSVPLTVTNRSAGTATVTVTLTVLPKE